MKTTLTGDPQLIVKIKGLKNCFQVLNGGLACIVAATLIIGTKVKYLQYYNQVKNMYKLHTMNDLQNFVIEIKKVHYLPSKV